MLPAITAADTPVRYFQPRDSPPARFAAEPCCFSVSTAATPPSRQPRAPSVYDRADFAAQKAAAAQERTKTAAATRVQWEREVTTEPLSHHDKRCMLKALLGEARRQYVEGLHRQRRALTLARTRSMANPVSQNRPGMTRRATTFPSVGTVISVRTLTGTYKRIIVPPPPQPHTPAAPAANEFPLTLVVARAVMADITTLMALPTTSDPCQTLEGAEAAERTADAAASTHQRSSDADESERLYRHTLKELQRLAFWRNAP